MEIAMTRGRLQRWAVAGLLAVSGPDAGAMGGHFDVDDATVLGPGRCQVELWWLHGQAAQLLHAGPGCRAGPVELALALDRVRRDDERDRIAGAQAKWVTAWVPNVLDIGAVLVATHDEPRDVTLFTAYVPITWTLHPALQLHANLGADRTTDGRHAKRIGAAGEWALNDKWSLLAERLHALEVISTRVGLRWSLSEQSSIDLSLARLSGSGKRLGGLGWTFEWGR